MTTAIITPAPRELTADEADFDFQQRRAKLYAASTLVPKEFQGNLPNVVIAVNMANRLGADVLMTMQNLYVVHGRPGWSAQFLIATFNTCRRFSAIKYRFTGERNADSWGCVAYATELATGDMIEGTEITLKMAKAEGWYQKNGSKWQSMPEQMLRYRAAAFLVRSTAPELGMGLMTVEELNDLADDEPTPPPRRVKNIAELTQQFQPEQPATLPATVETPPVTVEPSAAVEAMKAQLSAAVETPPRPAVTVESLLAQLAAARTAEDIADVTYLRTQLVNADGTPDEKGQTQIEAAGRARKAELRAEKAGTAK